MSRKTLRYTGCNLTHAEWWTVHVIHTIATGFHYFTQSKEIWSKSPITEIEICGKEEWQFKVLTETTNEWLLIASLKIYLRLIPRLLSVDDRLYVLATRIKLCDIHNLGLQNTKVEGYNQKSKIPLTNMSHVVTCCSTRIFEGFLMRGLKLSSSPFAYSKKSGWTKRFFFEKVPLELHSDQVWEFLIYLIFTSPGEICWRALLGF